MSAFIAGLMIAALVPNPGAQLFGVVLIILGLGFLALQRMERVRPPVDAQELFYVVVNASDPDRHEVAWYKTRQFAEDLARDLHLDHGWRYAVEEHTGDDDCLTCRLQSNPAAVLCYAVDSPTRDEVRS
jgi:hypothetical protein